MHPPSLRLLHSFRTCLRNSNRLLFPARGAILQAPLIPAHHCWCLSSTNRNYSNQSSNGDTHASPPQKIVHRTQPPKPQTHDRGPPSSEKTQTDFSELNVLGSIPAPATAVDACLDDGFHLDNGAKVTGGDGILLVGGEAFRWRPWEAFRTENVGFAEYQECQHYQNLQASMVNAKGQFEVPEEVWGLLSLIWPRPGGCSQPF
jgi:hypothetical protein